MEGTGVLIVEGTGILTQTECMRARVTAGGRDRCTPSGKNWDTYPNRVCEGEGDSQWKTFRHSNNKNSDTNDEELDKITEVNHTPWFSIHNIFLNAESNDENEHSQNSHGCTYTN